MLRSCANVASQLSRIIGRESSAMDGRIIRQASRRAGRHFGALQDNRLVAELS